MTTYKPDESGVQPAIPAFVHVLLDETGGIVIDGTGRTPDEAMAPLRHCIETELNPVRMTMDMEGTLRAEPLPDHAVLVNLRALARMGQYELVNLLLVDPGLHAVYQLGKRDGMLKMQREAEHG